MLGLILDVMVLLVLIRAAIGDDEEGFGKPVAIAVMAAIGMMVANGIAAASPESSFWILIGAVFAVGFLIVALGTFVLFQVEFHKALIVAAGYTIYKSVFVVFLVSMYS